MLSNTQTNQPNASAVMHFGLRAPNGECRLFVHAGGLLSRVRPAQSAAAVLAFLFLVGCAATDEQVSQYEAISAELDAEIQAAEKRITTENLEPAERDKLLERVAKLKIAKAEVDKFVAKLIQVNTDQHPLVVTGETAQAVGSSLPPAIGVWVSLVGGLLASVGRNVYQSRRIKNNQEALASVHANRRSNGDVNADFSAETSAILRAHMSAGAKAEVKKAQRFVDPALIDAIDVVSRSKPKRRASK